MVFAAVDRRGHPVHGLKAEDFLVFEDRKPIGVVEAKPVGRPLSGVEPPSEKYSAGLPDHLVPWRRPLPFLYESTGVETFFTCTLDPEPRSRRVFAFHRPETLAEWAAEGRGDPAATWNKARSWRAIDWNDRAKWPLTPRAGSDTCAGAFLLGSSMGAVWQTR